MESSTSSSQSQTFRGMPDGSEGPKRSPTFNTLAREEQFRSPPKDGSTYSILNEFVTPHIESFNALFDDSGLPSGDGDGKGLLSLALKDIGERIVFDGNGQADSENGPKGWGNRMRSKLRVVFQQSSDVDYGFQYGLSKSQYRDLWSPKRTKLRSNAEFFQQK